MPVICVFENENIKVYIYNFDHKKPHIHIVKKGKTSKKGVDMLFDGTLPHGSEGLSNADIEVVREWLLNHLETVNEDWNLAEQGRLVDQKLASSVSTDITENDSTEQESLNESVDTLEFDDDDVYVVDAIPLPHHHLLCHYNNGRWNLVDFRPLLQYPAFRDLKSEQLFYDIDFSNGVTNWDNERIDIAPEYLYKNGISLSADKVEFLKFVKNLNSDSDADLLGAIIEGFIACVA